MIIEIVGLVSFDTTKMKIYPYKIIYEDLVQTKILWDISNQLDAAHQS